jgi:hypothetical protein
MRAIDDLPFDVATPIQMRLSTARDLDRVLALWAQTAPARERLKNDLRAEPPWLELVLVERGAQLLACAAFAVTYASAEAKPALTVEEWLVVSGPRGIAAVEPLVRACAEQALSRGCTSAFLAVSDEAARSAWRRCGAFEAGPSLRLDLATLSALARRTAR